MSNELRWNPILGTWVIVSSKRESRPWREEKCPFCPGTPETGYGWDVLVLDNRFPALRPDARTSVESRDIYRVEPGYGYCKVVIESPEHEGDLDTIPIENLRKYLRILGEETAKLCRDKEICYVIPFRNKGELIGVSLTHPHSQIYALPFIPPRINIELKNAREFYKKHNECLFCHILGFEEKEGKRVLYRNKLFTSFLPFFAMWPYEVHIYPRKHVLHLSDLDSGGIEYLADILRVTVSMYNRLFDFSLPYIMIFHQAPCRGNYNYYHLHIEFYPVHRARDKLKYPAGIEWGAWVFTYDDLPENKVAELRYALQKAVEYLRDRGYSPMGRIISWYTYLGGGTLTSRYS